MPVRPVHKYIRKLVEGDQFILCSGKKANYSEQVAYRWNKVTCRKCQKLKK